MPCRLPFSLQKQGVQLLHQQCSLWGCDVRRAEGNLLLLQGFERVRPPKRISGCSQYTLTLPDGLRLRLWGFGFFIGGQHGIYVNRYTFAPRSIAMSEDVWEAGHFAGAPFSQDFGLLAQALRAIVRTEEWLLREVGLPYREQCLRSFDKGFLTPFALIEAWQDLERRIQRFGEIAVRRASHEDLATSD